MPNQYQERSAWQCQKCKAIFFTESGMDRHSAKCNYAEPEMEGQVSFYEQGGEQRQGDALCQDRLEA